MAYKIGINSIILESDGKSVLVTEGAFFQGNKTVGSTEQTLSKDYIADYFVSPIAGSTTGYVAGGSAGSTFYNIIDKYPFAISSGTATDVGDLTNSGWSASGSSSSSHGYQAGSNQPVIDNVIQKFPFSSDTNATDVGDLTVSRAMATGSHSPTHGYATGGNTPSFVNVIDKYTFNADANATDVGDLITVKGWAGGGNSSTTHGYSTGNDDVGNSNVIQKFPFSVDTNATDVGDLLLAYNRQAAQSADTHGYVSGGYESPLSSTSGAPSKTIQKFPFATDANATFVGDLSQTRNGGGGQTSENYGFTSGGYDNGAGQVTTMDRFPLATDTTATGVGNITVSRQYVTSNNMI